MQKIHPILSLASTFHSVQVVLDITLFQTLVEEGFDFMLATSSFEGQCWTPLLVGYLLTEEIALASKKKLAGEEPCID